MKGKTMSKKKDAVTETAEEIMEVMELATLLSISTMDVGLEVLEKELAQRQA